MNRPQGLLPIWSIFQWKWNNLPKPVQKKKKRIVEAGRIFEVKTDKENTLVISLESLCLSKFLNSSHLVALATRRRRRTVFFTGVNSILVKFLLFIVWFHDATFWLFKSRRLYSFLSFSRRVSDQKGDERLKEEETLPASDQTLENATRVKSSSK